VLGRWSGGSGGLRSRAWRNPVTSALALADLVQEETMVNRQPKGVPEGNGRSLSDLRWRSPRQMSARLEPLRDDGVRAVCLEPRRLVHGRRRRQDFRAPAAHARHARSRSTPSAGSVWQKKFTLNGLEVCARMVLGPCEGQGSARLPGSPVGRRGACAPRCRHGSRAAADFRPRRLPLPRARTMRPPGPPVTGLALVCLKGERARLEA